jgi:hypothetical protein
VTAADDDEERWTEAEALLPRWKPEPADRRSARERQDGRLFVASLVLVGSALALALVLLAVDPPPDTGDGPPRWRAVTGFSVSGFGLLFLVVGAALRMPRRRAPLKWGRPLRVLTPRQRKELLQQVRGRARVAPERVPLARHSAEALLDQQGTVLVPAALLVTYLGLWIVDRSTVRTLLTLAFVVALAVAAVHTRRDLRRARRFLGEHPPPGGG